MDWKLNFKSPESIRNRKNIIFATVSNPVVNHQVPGVSDEPASLTSEHDTRPPIRDSDILGERR